MASTPRDEPGEGRPEEQGDFDHYDGSTSEYTDPSISGTSAFGADYEAPHPPSTGQAPYEQPQYADYAYPSSGQSYPQQPSQSSIPPSAVPPMAYAPPGYQPAMYPASPRRDRSLMIVLICIAVLLVVGLVIVGAYFLLNNGSDSATETQSTPTVTQTVNPPQTSTVTVAPAGPPPGAASCGAGVSVGTSVTSCSFAQAVRAEYLRTGAPGQARVITAYSSVTGMSYVMSCTPDGGAVVCRGGNDAVVYVY